MPESLGPWLERKLVKTWPLVVFHTCWICYGSTRYSWMSGNLNPTTTWLMRRKSVAHPWKWCFTKWLIQPTYCNKTRSSTLDISRSYPQQIPRLPFTTSAPPPLLSSWLVVHLPVFGTKPCEKNKHVLNHQILDHLKDLSEHHKEMVMFTPEWHEQKKLSKDLCNLAPSSFFSCFARVDPLHKFWR